MRLHRAHRFVLDALAKAPDVQSADAWDRGDHTVGVHVTFTTGAQMWLGVTVAAAPGDTGEGEEIPVPGPIAADVPWPDLYEDEKVTAERAQAYFAAAVTNSGHPEVVRGYGYDAASTYPGFGVFFHSGARAHCLFHHNARPGQNVGGRELQAAV